MISRLQRFATEGLAVVAIGVAVQLAAEGSGLAGEGGGYVLCVAHVTYARPCGCRLEAAWA